MQRCQFLPQNNLAPIPDKFTKVTTGKRRNAGWSCYIIIINDYSGGSVLEAITIGVDLCRDQQKKKKRTNFMLIYIDHTVIFHDVNIKCVQLCCTNSSWPQAEKSSSFFNLKEHAQERFLSIDETKAVCSKSKLSASIHIHDIISSQLNDLQSFISMCMVFLIKEKKNLTPYAISSFWLRIVVHGL